MADSITTGPTTIGAANAAATVQVPNDMQTALVQIVNGGSFVGTIIFEGLLPDGVTWQTLDGVTPAGAVVASVSAAGAWRADCTGMSQARARCSAYTSGSCTAYIQVVRGDVSLTTINVGSASGLALEATQLLNKADLDAINTATATTATQTTTTATQATNLNTAIGTTADAAYTSGNGSHTSLLKGIFGRLAALGQAVMASSIPVAIASDQSTLSTAGPLGVLIDSGSAVSVNATGTLATEATAKYRWLLLLINITGVTGGSSPTIAFSFRTTDAFAQDFALYAPAALNSTGQTSYGVGPSSLNQNIIVPPTTILKYTVTGSPTSIVFNWSLYGR